MTAGQEVLAVEEVVAMEETATDKEIPIAEAIRLAADLAEVAKSVLEVVSGGAEFACFTISEVLIEQEKPAACSPEASQILTEDKAVKVVVKVAPEIEKKEVPAISTEVIQVPTPPIKEAEVPKVSTGEGATYKADIPAAENKLIGEAKAEDKVITTGPEASAGEEKPAVVEAPEAIEVTTSEKTKALGAAVAAVEVAAKVPKVSAGEGVTTEADAPVVERVL